MGLKVTSQTAHGPVDWYYVLSTPEKVLAQPNELDKRIPTVLVLVPGFSLLVSAHRRYFLYPPLINKANAEPLLLIIARLRLGRTTHSPIS